MSELDAAYRRIVGDDAQRSALITDPAQSDNPVVFASQGFYRLTGYDPDEVIGGNCRMLQGADTDPQAVAEIREAIAARRPITRDILNYRKDGTPFWNRLRIRPVDDPQSGGERFVGVQNEIAPGEVRDAPIYDIVD